jgi:hypothetical protein
MTWLCYQTNDYVHNNLHCKLHLDRTVHTAACWKCAFRCAKSRVHWSHLNCPPPVDPRRPAANEVVWVLPPTIHAPFVEPSNPATHYLHDDQSDCWPTHLRVVPQDAQEENWEDIPIERIRVMPPELQAMKNFANSYLCWSRMRIVEWHISMLGRCQLGLGFLMLCLLICVGHGEQDWQQVKEGAQWHLLMPQIACVACSEFLFATASIEFLFVHSPFSLHSSAISIVLILNYLSTSLNPVIQPDVARELLKVDLLWMLILATLLVAIFLHSYKRKMQGATYSPQLLQELMNDFGTQILTLLSTVAPFKSMPEAVRKLWQPAAPRASMMSELCGRCFLHPTFPRIVDFILKCIRAVIFVLIIIGIAALLTGVLAAIDSHYANSGLDQHEYWYTMFVSLWFLLSVGLTVGRIPFSGSRDVSAPHLIFASSIGASAWKYTSVLLAGRRMCCTRCVFSCTSVQKARCFGGMRCISWCTPPALPAGPTSPCCWGLTSTK